MATGDAQRYTDAMAGRSFGYGLFHPPRFADMRPGMVGYIDDNGRWHRIADLTNSDELRKKGFSDFILPVADKPDRVKLGPVLSENVHSHEIALEADAAAAAVALGLPVDIGGVIEYATEDNFGAILMCDDEVVFEGFDVRDVFVQWLKDKKNQSAILKNHRDVKRYGVCVVRGTSSAEQVYLRTWSGAGDRVRVGFKLGFTGVAALNPEVAYYRANHGAGWRRFDGEKRVVFFTGVKFSYNFLGRGREDRSGAAFRGDGGDTFTFEDPDEAGMVYDVTIEEFGPPVAEGEDDDFEGDGEDD
ncbi:hypothetical protein PG993_009163 [Apiospora rasikravindrae]|uniref:Uncharacterized protein n=1 Tax=Apiospora rasikravindrae TaxID=990691 RepID=A0ABR1SIL0_9PEZI